MLRYRYTRYAGTPWIYGTTESTWNAIAERIYALYPAGTVECLDYHTCDWTDVDTCDSIHVNIQYHTHVEQSHAA